MARLNNAKNEFAKWLKDHNAEVFEGEELEGEDFIYRFVGAYVGRRVYMAYFEMWKSNIKISFSDEENSYDNMDVEEFLQLIK